MPANLLPVMLTGMLVHPTAMQLFGVRQVRPSKSVAPPLECRTRQLVPPSTLATTAPTWPAARQWLRSGQVTPLRARVVPEACVFQLAPPAALLRIVPLSPTMMQGPPARHVAP